jgi:hypothetical protein
MYQSLSKQLKVDEYNKESGTPMHLA